MTLSSIELNWLELLGTGSNGTAYEYDNKCLKVTDNEYEFLAAKKLMNSPQSWSCIIFDVEDLGNGEYLILKEKVQIEEYDPTDENGEFYGQEGTLKSLEGVLHTPWDLCRSWTKEGKTWKDLTEKEINHISKKQTTKIGADCYKWFYAAYKSAESFQIDTCDLYQNIGMRENGEFVFFDVMVEKF